MATTKERLHDVDAGNFGTPPGLSGDDFLTWFDLAAAVWLHKGKPTPDKPHGILTSCMCTDGYFDVPRLLSFTHIAELAGRQLVWNLLQAGVERSSVDWVVSSAYSAITFGHEVAKSLHAQFGNVEKDPNDPAGKRMLWRRLSIPEGARILQAEELITTTGTTNEVRRAVEEGNPNPVIFLPIVGAFVLRPPKLPLEYGERRVVALIEREIHAFKPGPEDCPHCKVGSPRYKPKENWSELTGQA